MTERFVMGSRNGNRWSYFSKLKSQSKEDDEERSPESVVHEKQHDNQEALKDMIVKHKMLIFQVLIVP